jgi:hypothetical protein
LIVDTHQNKEDIKNINDNLISINSDIQVLQEQFSYIKDLKATFEHFMGCSQNPSSYENHLIRMTMTLPITKVLILPTFLDTSSLPELR